MSGLQALALAAGHDHREDARRARGIRSAPRGRAQPQAGSRSGKQKSSRSSRRSELVVLGRQRLACLERAGHLEEALELRVVLGDAPLGVVAGGAAS